MKPTLLAESLASDPRIDQAKKILLEAVAEHDGQLTAGIRPADPEPRRGSSKQMIEQFNATFASAACFVFSLPWQRHWARGSGGTRRWQREI